MIYIFSIPSECPLCSYDGTVALKIKLTNRVRWIIDNLLIFSGEEEEYRYAVKFIIIFSMYDTKQITDFPLSIDVNGIIIKFI